MYLSVLLLVLVFFSFLIISLKKKRKGNRINGFILLIFFIILGSLKIDYYFYVSNKDLIVYEIKDKWDYKKDRKELIYEHGFYKYYLKGYKLNNINVYVNFKNIKVVDETYLDSGLIVKERVELNINDYPNYSKLYDGKSLMVYDLSNSDILLYKDMSALVEPASLAKLFLVDYALSIDSINSVVIVSKESLEFAKPGSSLAHLGPGKYSMKDMVAAIMLPSGNDAALSLAVHIGGKLDPSLSKNTDKLNYFYKEYNKYLKDNYSDTYIDEASGFSYEAKTSAKDVVKVSLELLKYNWFRLIVSKDNYKCSNGLIFKNSNMFLNKNSIYYNKDVKGIKTGTLRDLHNIVVLYEFDGKEYLIVSLGSYTNELRYSSVSNIIKIIPEIK